MPYTFRPYDAATDRATAAALFARAGSPTVILEQVNKALGVYPPSFTAERLVAVAGDGALAGMSRSVHFPWTAAGSFEIEVVVDPAHRSRGLGATLYDRARDFAGSSGARTVYAYVGDADEGALAFATHRGFALDRHFFRSRLELAAFDDAGFASYMSAARDRGIRFVPLSGSTSEEWVRQLYDLCTEGQADIPGNEDEQDPYDDWRTKVVPPAGEVRETFLLAAEGDRLVGMTCCDRAREEGALYNRFTTVARSHRGLGLGVALKVLAIAAARGQGAAFMLTDNDSENAPILAVNRRLGYIPEPGTFRLAQRCGQ